MPTEPKPEGTPDSVADRLAARPAGTARSYSRFVSAMKIVLPAAALALALIVSAYLGLFGGGRSITPGISDGSTIDTDLRMVSPRLTGQDSAGRPYVITATAATQHPDNQQDVDFNDVEADVVLDDDGHWAFLRARGGTLYGEEEKLTLKGDIDIYTDQGYQFHGQSAAVDIAANSLVSEEPVNGHGPAGTLRANSMSAEAGGERMRFDGDVRVVIYGRKQGEQG